MSLILVGSSGYIGREFASRLLRAGTSYLPIENRQKFDSLNEGFWRDIQNETTVIWTAGELNRNQEDITAEKTNLEKVRFEKFVEGVSLNDYSLIRVLFMSSGGAIYKNFTKPPLETDACTQTNRYGILKQNMEKLLFQYNINHVSLRLGNVYGPNIDKQFGVIANWARCIRENKELLLTESLDSQRDYINISDVIDFTLLLRDSTFCGPINVATGVSTSLSQILDIFKYNYPNLKIDWSRIQESNTKITSQGAIDVSLARKLFLWKSKIILKEGLDELLTSLK